MMIRKNEGARMVWPASTRFFSYKDQPSRVSVSKMRTIVLSKLL